MPDSMRPTYMMIDPVSANIKDSNIMPDFHYHVNSVVFSFSYIMVRAHLWRLPKYSQHTLRSQFKYT